MDEANKLFLFYKSKLIKKLGVKALWTDQINTAGNALFGSKWLGCKPQDRTLFKPGYQIINVDTSKQKGTHWIALYQTNSVVYVYDSYGRSTPQLLKILTKKAKGLKLRIVDSEFDPEQFGAKSEICGVLCLAWLLVVKHLGIREALRI